jgi:hypothetical protein
MQQCFTIKEFCETHRINPQLFRKLDQSGLAPKAFFVGRRRLISAEAAREWRQFMWEKFPATRAIDIPGGQPWTS